MANHFARVCGVLVVLGLHSPASFGADVYKWTDARGTINYAAKPPANGKATTLSPAASRLTIYQSNVREVEARVRAADAGRAPLHAFEMQGSSGDLPGSNERAYRELWLQRCRADRRVDCDDPLAYFGYGAGYPYYPYGPIAYGPPPRRIQVPLIPVVQPPPPPPLAPPALVAPIGRPAVPGGDRKPGLTKGL
jgi:Domain of unknown function (DUF4124)